MPLYSVFADRDAEAIYKECGIGGIIFGSSSPFAAFFSNVTTDLGTTAVSSHVSSADICISSAAANVAFIHNGYDSILNDAAKGNGEYLTVLSKISNQDVNSIRSSIAKLASVSGYTAQTKEQKSKNLYNSIM